MPKPPVDVAEAIEIVEYARWTHEYWAALMEDPTKAAELRPAADVAGDAAFHRGVMAKYDKVLAVLRRYESHPSEGRT